MLGYIAEGVFVWPMVWRDSTFHRRIHPLRNRMGLTFDSDTFHAINNIDKLEFVPAEEVFRELL